MGINDYEEYTGFCMSCVHWKKEDPGPCGSCDQETPTNFTEEEVKNEI